MNQREVIYADMHMQSAESCKFGTILDDNQVEYAKLNHGIKMTKKMWMLLPSKMRLLQIQW